jgi:hypothetical protein
MRPPAEILRQYELAFVFANIALFVRTSNARTPEEFDRIAMESFCWRRARRAFEN